MEASVHAHGSGFEQKRLIDTRGKHAQTYASRRPQDKARKDDDRVSFSADKKPKAACKKAKESKSARVKRDPQRLHQASLHGAALFLRLWAIIFLASHPVVRASYNA